MTDTPILQAVGVSKYFGATVSLADVSLAAHPGRVVALLGDNGAGKSTLVKIFSGVMRPDRGELRMRGELVRFNSPRDARERGIATTFQDLAVCGLMSITRNVVLGHEPTKGWGPFRWLDMKAAERQAHEAMAALGLPFKRHYGDFAETASGGERQAVAIARAMYYGSSCLLLDEPTAALAVRPARRVLDHIVAAKDAGHAVIFITHDFRHALEVADDLVVLSLGRVRGTFSRGEIDLDGLTRLVSES
jgi:simple sugar transport system ATP-binding protein